jgi:hypothetical protein
MGAILTTLWYGPGNGEMRPLYGLDNDLAGSIFVRRQGLHAFEQIPPGAAFVERAEPAGGPIHVEAVFPDQVTHTIELMPGVLVKASQLAPDQPKYVYTVQPAQ